LLLVDCCAKGQRSPPSPSLRGCRAPASNPRIYANPNPSRTESIWICAAAAAQIQKLLRPIRLLCGHGDAPVADLRSWRRASGRLAVMATRQWPTVAAHASAARRRPYGRGGRRSLRERQLDTCAYNPSLTWSSHMESQPLDRGQAAFPCRSSIGVRPRSPVAPR
jgi:hypothetical protein